MSAVVKLLPVSTIRDADTLLAEFAGELTDMCSRTEAVERLTAWRTWSPRAALRTRALFRERSVRYLVLGEQYAMLHSLPPTSAGAALAALIDNEIQERLDRIAAARRELRDLRTEWGFETTAVLIDTNLLMHAGPRLAGIDWDSLLGTATRNAAFVIPIQVVEELDRLKFHRGSEVRSNAAYALKWLADVLPAGAQSAPFATKADGTTIRIWVDDNDRVPLPAVDRDIIDRAMELQTYTTRTVIVSMDRSMVLRASHHGVDAALVTVNAIPPRSSD